MKLVNVDMKNLLITSILFLLLLVACNVKKPIISNENTSSINLEKNFNSPPDSVKPWIYWYWINDNISKKGITQDLETMAKVGIGEAFIGNIGLPGTPDGKVPFFSEGWWKLTKHAMHEGARTGVNIGLFNGPGWSQSGGPWIKPNQSMRYLVHKDWKVEGPKRFSQKLKMGYNDFQQVAVLAFPQPKDEDKIISNKTAKIHAAQIQNLQALFDNDPITSAAFPTGDKSVTIDISTESPFTARSLTLYPSGQPASMDCALEDFNQDKWQTVKKFTMDRSNPNLNVGPMPYGPVAISFPDVRSSKFRLVFSNIQGQAGLSDIHLSSAPKLDNYVEKQLGKMYPAPHPMWDAYEWPSQAEVNDKSMDIDPSAIINITKYLSKDSTLSWDVPKGNWIIESIGMTPTGVTNSPAVPAGTGLEVDKMNTKDITAHFNAFVGRVLDSISPEDKKAFKHVVADSYETGSENWTEGFDEDFKKRYGYDPKLWLPVLSGRIVRSADQSNRFLWDMRRLIATNIAYKYVGGLRKLSEAHGMQTWLENYGHWGFPSEFLMYGGQSNNISGEFWAEGDLGSIELRDASSAAHIYGKRQVWAESFTAGGLAFLRYPAMLKKRGDWAFTQGVNHTLLHVYIEQPYDSVPGMNAWFGTEFNRQNTWFGQSKVWMDYIRRCNYMLQRGKPVEDVCYYIGEDAPKMTGIEDPKLPEGYSFDWINAEVIENRLSVKNGNLVLPDGLSYRLMVLPPEKTMRPEVLKKIRDLVAAGATILGTPPTHSPSLENYPMADNEVKEMARKLWQHCDGKNLKAVKFGKGMVLRGMDMQTALDKLGVIPDVKIPHGAPLLYIHRKMADADIYFLTNQSDSIVEVSPAFRVTGKQPELWNAVTGTIRALPAFQQEKGKTIVPLKFQPSQSWFVVFRKTADSSSAQTIEDNFPDFKLVQQISGPWLVTFNNKMRGPAQPVIFERLTDWSKSDNDSIRYYSGTADYQKNFTIRQLPEGRQFFLNLGNVNILAHVKLNGIEIGGVWTAPWQINITGALRKGENKLEISVVNLWVNRLIGDSGLPMDQRKTWTPVNPYNTNSSLQPSGLLGPVTIQSVKYLK